MKKNTTYNPQDIEDLLLNKSFDELYQDEKEFVLTQVENEQEYKELRNTLISVKQIAEVEESVYVPNKIKEDLMQLMEKKKKPFGWFNLNSIGAFLFPSNTPLFKKPGLQLVTLGLMLLLAVNIGIDFISQPNKELAINTNQKPEETETLKKVVKEEEPAENVEISQNGQVENLKKREVPNAPAELEEVQDKLGFFDVEDAKAEEVVEIIEIMDEAIENIDVHEPKVANAPVLQVRKNADLDQIIELDEEIAVAKYANAGTAVTFNSYTGKTTESVSLNAVEVTSVKQKKSSERLKSTMNSKSQNLNDNADVIDLLFVTL